MKLMVGMIVLAIVVCSLFFVLSTRTIAEAVAPDGTEFKVVQGWGDDFWNTAVFYRSPGKPWGWFYYDHDDYFWARGKVEVDTSEGVFRVHRKGIITATFRWGTEEFVLSRPNFPRRHFKAAQEWFPDNHDPTDTWPDVKRTSVP